MGEKNPQKLAAARRMLKEYQKKNKENSTPLQLKQTKTPLQQSNESIINYENLRTNNVTKQNYVYDSGTTNTNLEESDNIYNSRKSDNSCVNSEINSDLNKENAFISHEKGNIDTNNVLINPMNDHPCVTENQALNSFFNTNERNDVNELKSAKDFFDSLTNTLPDNDGFSFTTFNSNLSDNNLIINTNVPSTNYQSNQDNYVTDNSESVVITPSEPDKSDISSPGDSPKKISEVLELQLQEIDTKLGIEIDKNKILNEQLQQSHNHISQLDENIEVMKKTNAAKIVDLEEKLQLHVKTLEILVSEKTELQTTLTACQESISQKAGEVEELQNRLRASRHRVSDLERDLGLTQKLLQQHEKAAHEAICSRDVLKNEVDLMRKRLDESVEEILDLKHKLEEKSVEINSLNEKHEEKNSQLSVLQLKVDQLSSPEVNESCSRLVQDNLSTLQNENKELQQQVLLLNNELKKVITERDEANSQYQQYVTSLNSQLQTMAAKYENVCNQCDNLSSRESSLVEHIASLEKQLQQTLSNKVASTASTSTASLQMNELRKVQQQLENKMAEKKQFEEQLTSQLTENAKLTEALEEYTLKVIHLERTVERLEADRPDACLLQAAIESDKVAASRAIAQNTELKKQLEELQNDFIKLSNSKLELTEKLEKEERHCEELSKKLSQANTELVNEKKSVDNDRDADVEKVDFCSQTYNVKDVDIADITIDLDAMAKLEDKFKRKMQEVAELSDEKQRLEHLVLQLQCETETIGEYITLYQKQRGLLRQRNQEKDEQMARLSQERELLKNKLCELNHLIQTLFPGSENQSVLKSIGDKISELEHDQVVNPLPSTNNVNQNHPDASLQQVDKEETAGKIRALLTEISSSKLVTPDDEVPNFHHCPLCSGRLITV